MKKIFLTILLFFIGMVGAYANDEVPLLQVVSVSDTSITLRVSSEMVDKNDICYIYKSLDGINYDNKIVVNCNQMYVDKNVESENSYYYKANVGSSDVYSEEVLVVTESLDGSKLENNIDKKNNFVQSFWLFMIITVVFLVLMMLMILYKKKLYKSK